MAQYEHLPIFRKSIELGVYLDQVVRNFSRYHKYSVGEDIRGLTRQIFLLIIRANSAWNKESALRDLVSECSLKNGVHLDNYVN